MKELLFPSVGEFERLWNMGGHVLEMLSTFSLSLSYNEAVRSLGRLCREQPGSL